MKDMKNGLAIWHYPHRTVLENVAYFAKQGYDSVSLHGSHMVQICSSEEASAELADIIKETGLVLTVHHKLPRSHEETDVVAFRQEVDLIAAWQEKYRLLHIYSFDVPQLIRDSISPDLDYVLGRIKETKIAVEDFGLTEAECSQIDYLKGNPRFGYLIDIGHMFIRLRGKNGSGRTLFTHSESEGPVTDSPNSADFAAAFRSKGFPIFEMHLHNNDGIEDMHYFLEDGCLKVEEVARAVKALKFDGVMTIESAPGFRFACEYPESDERIAATFGYWRDIWAHL